MPNWHGTKGAEGRPVEKGACAGEIDEEAASLSLGYADEVGDTQVQNRKDLLTKVSHLGDSCK